MMNVRFTNVAHSPSVTGVQPTFTPRPLLTLAGVRSVFKKELIQLSRDRYLMAFIIALPVMQLLVTGVAVQKDVRHVPTPVYNYDRGQASQELLTSLQQSGYFELVPAGQQGIQTEEDLLRSVKQGRYRLGVIIPSDYSKNLLTGNAKANVNVVLDGTNANISKGLLDAVRAITQNQSMERLKQRRVASPNPVGTAALSNPIELQTKIINNPDLSPSMFLIPGILGVIMHMMTVLLTSGSIVREREAGTLEQLMVSPLQPAELMLGKVLPYALIGLLDMVLTLSVMVGFFNISVTGGIGFLWVASLMFILNSLGLGLLLSTLSRTQTQSVQMTMGLLLPSLLLSGFVFPIEPMPWFIKLISYVLPLTYYLDIIRGVVIKSGGFVDLYTPFFLLMLSTCVLIGLSISRFRKQLS
ncbi:MAG: ABC transporter permease [Vampirovibrionales bacterium]